MGTIERLRTLDAFPEKVCALLDEIESYADVEVGFELRVGATEAAALSINHEGATILLDDFDEVPVEGAVHELLHLHRYWPQQVPSIVAIDRANKNIVDGIDNAIEHLFVVPQQIQMGYEVTAYWTEMARGNWTGYPDEWSDDPATRRRVALIAWLTLKLTNDDSVTSLAERCTNEEGLLPEARRFVRRIESLQSSKPRMVSAVFRFCNLPMDGARLATFDIRDRKLVHTEIPPH